MNVVFSEHKTTQLYTLKVAVIELPYERLGTTVHLILYNLQEMGEHIVIGSLVRRWYHTNEVIREAIQISDALIVSERNDQGVEHMNTKEAVALIANLQVQALMREWSFIRERVMFGSYASKLFRELVELEERETLDED